MAKYYVESGTVRLIVSAADPRRAALWTVHRTLEHILPDAPVVIESEDEKFQVLGDRVRLSERGFDRADSAEFDTLELVSEWSRLMIALSKMESDLSETDTLYS